MGLDYGPVHSSGVSKVICVYDQTPHRASLAGVTRELLDLPSEGMWRSTPAGRACDQTLHHASQTFRSQAE
jgi:hypothetical protein